MNESGGRRAIRPINEVEVIRSIKSITRSVYLKKKIQFPAAVRNRGL
jgi:hypothetical protein